MVAAHQQLFCEGQEKYALQGICLPANENRLAALPLLLKSKSKGLIKSKLAIKPCVETIKTSYSHYI